MILFWSIVVIFLTKYFDCAAAQQPFANCNQTINLKSNSVFNLSSPAGGYNAGSSCIYNIIAPVDQQISLTCSINLKNPGNCQADRFFVDLTGTGGVTLPKASFYCGQLTFTNKTNGNLLTLAYVSTINTGTFQCNLTTLCDCGWNINSRIVGGTNAAVGEFPSMAGLISVSQKMIYCGATVISSNYVLTAAHCLLLAKFPITDTAILVGDTDLSVGNDSPNSQLIKPSKFIPNPNYSSVTNFNDIGLILLATSIVWSKTVAPICLPIKFTSANFANNNVILTGWGSTSFGGPLAKVMQKVNVVVDSPATCKNSYPNISDTQMCTFAQNKDACQSDSGGPVFFRAPNNRLFHVGLVSAGDACATSKPGINTRTTSFLSFINDVTGLKSSFCSMNLN